MESTRLINTSPTSISSFQCIQSTSQLPRYSPEIHHLINRTQNHHLHHERESKQTTALLTHGRQPQSSPKKDTTPPSHRGRRQSLYRLLGRLPPRPIARMATQTPLRSSHRIRMSLCLGILAHPRHLHQVPLVQTANYKTGTAQEGSWSCQ